MGEIPAVTEPDPLLVQELEWSLALKEYLQVLSALNVEVGKSLGEPKAIEDYQAKGVGLQRVEGLVLEMGWPMSSVLVFEAP